MTPGVHPERYASRIAALQAALPGCGADAALVGVGADLEWLTGYAATGLERLNLLIVPADGRVRLVVPLLEAPAAAMAPGIAGGDIGLATWIETDDPFDLAARALPPLRTSGRRRLLVSDGLRAAFLLRLQAAIPDAAFDVASSCLGPLRRSKDADEVALLRAAAAAADRAMMGVLGGRLVGRSEADIAREVRDRLVAEGHDTAQFAIVAAGPHSASPHHEPGDTVVEAGTPLLLDIGGRLRGYCSDITRTAWLTGDGGRGPDDGFRRIHAIVHEAQAAGRRAARPGISGEGLDAVAREVIAAAGHAEHFFHRLGHGIGLEVHEDPYLVPGNAGLLRPGDAFSIEPGIYLEGRHGVRIEDILVCTDTSAEVLNDAPRHLLEVGGT
jgi:Xaa-Pro aminopeptidase